MTAPYRVTWGDCAGELGSKQFSTFEAALSFYRTTDTTRGLRAFISGDGAEMDGEEWHDGLTEEERDQL